MSKAILLCWYPDYRQPRTKFCTACLNEGYCSSECQKKDWKIHKIICPYMKDSEKLIGGEKIEPILCK